jgi:hypothetical protein
MGTYRPGDGLKRGAHELLDKYHYSQRDIAEAYIKGSIPKHLEPFIWDVICNQHVEEARKRLNRKAWRLEERVAKLEEEVRALQTNDR